MRNQCRLGNPRQQEKLSWVYHGNLYVNQSVTVIEFCLTPKLSGHSLGVRQNSITVADWLTYHFMVQKYHVLESVITPSFYG